MRPIWLRISQGVIREEGIPIASPTATPARHPYACLKSLLSVISIVGQLLSKIFVRFSRSCVAGDLYAVPECNTGLRKRT